MSAAVLREAAALIRERAKGATPGPWEVVRDSHRGYMDPAVEVSIWSDVAGRYVTEDVSMVESSIAQWEANAGHLASWHPAVALAVADWLEATADRFPPNFERYLTHLLDREQAGALSVADAYLGTTA